MDVEAEVVVDSVVSESSNPTNPILNPETQEDKVDDVPETQKKESEPVPKGVQRRIDRAVRSKYEAEARAKMLEERLSHLEREYRPQPQRQVDDKEPTLDKFENFDEYIAAKSSWIAKKEIAETLSTRENAEKAEWQRSEKDKQSRTWSQRIEKATVEMPDFEDVIASSQVPMTEPMQQVIMDSELGPKIAYYLATNPEEAHDILSMSPIGQVRALGRIEAKLEVSPQVKTTSAPPPVRPVGSKASASKDPGKMSDSEYAKWRKSGKAA